MTVALVPDPNDMPGTLQRAAVEGVGWTRHGPWRHRQFGMEVQLRCDALPHMPLDLYRAEAEALYETLGDILAQPAPLPFRLTWWDRFKQWSARYVWDRKNVETRERARREHTDHFLRVLREQDESARRPPAR